MINKLKVIGWLHFLTFPSCIVIPSLLPLLLTSRYECANITIIITATWLGPKIDPVVLVTTIIYLWSLIQNHHKSAVLVTLPVVLATTNDERSPFLHIWSCSCNNNFRVWWKISLFFISFFPHLLCFLCRLIIRLFLPSLPFLSQCTNTHPVLIR